RMQSPIDFMPTGLLPDWRCWLPLLNWNVTHSRLQYCRLPQPDETGLHPRSTRYYESEKGFKLRDDARGGCPGASALCAATERYYLERGGDSGACSQTQFHRSSHEWQCLVSAGRRPGTGAGRI